MRRLRPRLILIGSLAVMAPVLGAPASASANAFSRLQAAYTHSATGTIDPCAFSPSVLQAALREAPSYDFQYGADLTAAIHAALAGRSAGACRHRSVAGAGARGTGPRPAGPLPRPPGGVTASTGAGLPVVLVALFGLIGVALLVAGVAGLVWFLGIDSAGWRGAQHAVAEAEYRLQAGWATLADRLRR